MNKQLELILPILLMTPVWFSTYFTANKAFRKMFTAYYLIALISIPVLFLFFYNNILDPQNYGFIIGSAAFCIYPFFYLFSIKKSHASIQISELIIKRMVSPVLVYLSIRQYLHGQSDNTMFIEGRNTFYYASAILVLVIFCQIIYDKFFSGGTGDVMEEQRPILSKEEEIGLFILTVSGIAIFSAMFYFMDDSSLK